MEAALADRYYHIIRRRIGIEHAVLTFFADLNKVLYKRSLTLIVLCFKQKSNNVRSINKSVLFKILIARRKLDNTAKLVNEKLDSVKSNLTRVAQTEIDKALDSAIKTALDKQSGGLGTALLTNYGIEHVYPWRPSSWPVATKIYNDLSKSDVTTITVITNTVDKYFGYVAWGLVAAVWAIGLYLWLLVSKKVKAMIKPFNVCPRCGHTYADKRTALGLLKVFQPWTWF